jgi:hypothetical protein
MLVVQQAVLLVGFLQPEFESFRAMMIDMEADMVKVRGRSGAGLSSGSMTDRQFT